MGLVSLVRRRILAKSLVLACAAALVHCASPQVNLSDLQRVTLPERTPEGRQPTDAATAHVLMLGEQHDAPGEDPEEEDDRGAGEEVVQRGHGEGEREREDQEREVVQRVRVLGAHHHAERDDREEEREPGAPKLVEIKPRSTPKGERELRTLPARCRRVVGTQHARRERRLGGRRCDPSAPR